MAGALELNHYPVDSLVSALGEAFPSVHVGRQFEDSVSTASLAPFLARWVQHLDYERSGYVLEGYHVSVGTAATLAEQGFRVAVLGTPSVDVEQRCRDIRAFAAEGDWTEELSDSELADLIARYQFESVGLRAECERHGLAYFDTGRSSDADLDAVLRHLTEGMDEEDSRRPR